MNVAKRQKRFGAGVAVARIIVLLICAAPAGAADPTAEQVLFVCEHGNVKSIMAAAYFNELAAERKLPLRAVSRGAAANPARVPPAIVDALKAEGIDVSSSEPRALRPEDAYESRHIVSIGSELPRALEGTDVERWSDVPAASANYPAASESLRAHVRELLERLSLAR